MSVAWLVPFGIAAASPIPGDEIIVLAAAAWAAWEVYDASVADERIKNDDVSDILTQDSTLSPMILLTEPRTVAYNIQMVEPLISTNASIPTVNVGSEVGIGNFQDIQCQPRYCNPANPTDGELAYNKMLFNALLLQYFSSAVKAKIHIKEEDED